MIRKNQLKNRLIKAIFGCFFVFMSLFGTMTVFTDQVQAVSANTTETTTTTEETPRAVNEVETTDENKTSSTKNGCQDSLGAIGWLVCPTTGKISEAVDWLYEKIENILVINPIPSEDGTPIYEIWKYCRGFTNVVFIIFLLIVIYSQITGIGISNYGIKKVLPKLIITAILVNLSFVICSLAVDISNILGNSFRGLFNTVAEQAVAGGSSGMTAENRVSFANMFSSLAGGTALTVGALVIGFETGAIWMLIPVVLGAIVAVASGLITIALRQAVVALLIMISPLAMVAYMLPNTEDWFKKWKKLLTQMLVFYPMFSLLFGASNLAGFALISSAKDGFGLLLGVAVQIFPLFFSWSLMKMSGTFLGTINSRIRGLTSAPLASSRAWADSHRQLSRQKHLASDRATTPSLRLMQFVNNRRVAREEDISEAAKLAQDRGRAYRAQRNWKGAGATGTPTRRGERAYENIARSMEYQRVIARDSNNMNRGLGDLAVAGTTQKARLDRLDGRMVNAADTLKVEQARGEKIEYENAAGFHSRLDQAINANLDRQNRGNPEYKMHDLGSARTTAENRYDMMRRVMDGNVQDVQYAAATAAQGYDTQKKIYEAKMQKYFEMTPATKDVVLRLNELTRVDVGKNELAVNNIDAIVSGLRVLNQRGDTDLVKSQLDNILDKKIGGGIELGSHASQSLASFLMFEVKDNDPWLRRFGKYINLETANVYNKNNRKDMNITYDEYLLGYHTEPDGTKMYARKPASKLIEGTSLDNIERTALSNFDDSLKKAYGFDEKDSSKKWHVSEYLKKREEFQTAIEPAFLSSSLKWLSGSEQINSAVKFWTGYELKQKPGEDGNEPTYELSPVWRSKDFAGHEEEVESYFRRKTYDYFKDQTTGQILGMRTDYRDPAVEHLIEMYLEDDSGEETPAERRAWFENEKAAIQTRYGDENINVAESKRKNDLKNLKQEVAGRQLRKILDKTGKLEQIYNTRRSGASNNAKDWLRKMLNLDNKEEIYRYLDKKEQELKKQKTKQSDSADNTHGDTPSGTGSPYNDASFRLRVMTTLNKTFENSGDSPDPDEAFYEESLDFVKSEFSTVGGIVKQYEDFKRDNSHAGRSELMDKLEEILGNFFAEQIAEEDEK